MGCFCGVYLSWIVNRAIQNHGHRVDLSIDPPCYDVDDRNLDVMMDVNRGLRMNDPLDDHLKGDDHHDVPVGHRMNGMDDLKMDANHVNRNYALRDLNLVVMTDVNLCHRMNDQLNDQSLGVNLLNRSYVRHDLNLVVMTDVNLCHRMNDPQDDLMTDGNLDASRDLRMSDQLVDHLKDDDHRDVLVDHHMNGTDDRNDLNLDVKTGENRDRRMNDLLDDLRMGGNRVNRNYAPRDLKMGGNSDVKNLHVRLMVYLNMNCDRMSHDHLRCDRQMMRHRDTNRMDEMNLDGKMKIHHDCRPKKDDPTHLRRVNRRMKVCPKMDDRQMI
jgi:hypothetical protein